MELRGTTILAVRHKGHVALIGDGQVTMGQSIVMKHTAKKVRRMYKDQIVAGFAGATADAFTLFERFDAHLEQTGGNLIRAAVELAKDWRSDKFLRKLEAMLLVADRDHTLVLTGTGDVIEPDDGIASIGSGGPYALSAARALVRHSDLRGRGHRAGKHEDSLRALRVHQRPLHAGSPVTAANIRGRRRCRPAPFCCTPLRLACALSAYHPRLPSVLLLHMITRSMRKIIRFLLPFAFFLVTFTRYGFPLLHRCNHGIRTLVLRIGTRSDPIAFLFTSQMMQKRTN